MWAEKNLLSNTNNIISKTVIHHHTCKPRAAGGYAGRLDEPLQFPINQIIVYCSTELPQATQI